MASSGTTKSGKKTAAKSTKAKTNKSGKKIVKAAPASKTPAASSGGGLDMGSILTAVEHMIGGDSDDKSGGAGGLLSGVLDALTGGESDEGGGGGGLNVGSIVEMLLPLLSGDSGLLADFKKHPTKSIEKLIGIDLPDDKIDPVVEMVLDKLGHHDK